MTHILAIETSCDETAAAIIADGRRIVSNVVATQIEIHRRYGGVFPEVASRQHVLAIQPVVQQALTEANISELAVLDAIAVTQGPGLAGSLLVGVNMAKGMAFGSGLPLIPINHLEGHIYSNWLTAGEATTVTSAMDRFPTLVLIVSGGHTELILMHGHGDYTHLGGTIDDAAGEAFDKIARLLNLGFPGGPAIQKTAVDGDANRFVLPRPLSQDKAHRFNFSFSGLKTAVLNLTRELERQDADLTEPQLLADLAASFQEAVADVLVRKLVDAAQTHNVEQICICGGVSANHRLRELATRACADLGVPLYIPPCFFALTTPR
ncbi:MAG: tRNA (adenosine(37)-N6)-threonylcarbamoyltransferase complex transferase subunit TsaD [Caldilineaceae bacterium]